MAKNMTKTEKYPSGLKMTPKGGKSTPHASHGHKPVNKGKGGGMGKSAGC